MSWRRTFRAFASCRRGTIRFALSDKYAANDESLLSVNLRGLMAEIS